jgi:hypothetical protein
LFRVIDSAAIKPGIKKATNVSVRLNVVIVQSPTMTNLQVGIVADIVIQLIGQPGIDVAMVATLETNEEHSTDRLMLSGIENDLVVIDWCPAERMQESLRRAGLHTLRTAHSLDPQGEPAQAGQRRLYIVDLRQGFTAPEVVQAMLQLLRDRQIVAIPIGLPKPTPALPVVTRAQPTNSQPSGAIVERIAAPVEPRDEPFPSHAPLPSAVSKQSTTRPLDDDLGLEALVDSLNAIDL